MKKDLTRLRRIRRTQQKILNQGNLYLSVHRTASHIYAQVFSAWGKEVLACASSLEKAVRSKTLGPGKLKVAEEVGKLIAERAKAKGISRLAFNRYGYKYHGRIKALAEAARANGLDF